MSAVAERLRGVVRRAKAAVSPRAIILLYHRIADARAGTDPHNLCVSPRHFAEQMNVLSRSAHVLPLTTLARHVRDRSLPRRCVAVTFDDGYADNLHAAKPILERHAIPATVFVTTGLGGRTEEFYWDECERLVPADQCVATCDRVRDLPPVRRQLVMAELRGPAAATVRPTHRTMSDEEIRELASGGLIEVGAHTENHPALPVLSPDEQLAEVTRSKARLESVLGTAVTSFAYPYGLHSHATVEAVRAAGFERACTTEEHAARLASEPLRLPRFDMGDCDGDTFERKLRWAFGR